MEKTVGEVVSFCDTLVEHRVEVRMQLRCQYSLRMFEWFLVAISRVRKVEEAHLAWAERVNTQVNK